ncbi:magnesium transporter CorA family protein [Candidatus Pacearchaeota archaeon]|nr:magnesium transporter CorA family protein [Candidatus Pacearchaeota archaeon]
MIEYFNFNEPSKRIKKSKTFSANCWINVSNPTDAEVDSLVKKFQLSKENIIDGLDIHENPRFEIEGKHTYIYLTAPTNKIKQEYDSSFLIIYSKDFFMTLSKYKLEIFDIILDEKKQVSTFSKSRNLVKMLYMLSRSFEKSVHAIIKEAKKNKADLNKLATKDIAKLINNEDKLNTYISSFGSTISTYKRILRDKSLSFIKKDEEVIEDLIIDLNESLNLCKQTLKTISNMRSYYTTKLSNDLNKSVNILTIFTIFLSIPTLISSVYGMNIVLPAQSNPSIISILAVLMVGIWALMIFILKKIRMI